MSNNDQRVGEIEARLSAATPGLWAIDKYDTTPFESIVSIANDYPGGWVEVARSIGDDAKFITNAPADVAYLLAELRKAHEALARVETLTLNPEHYDSRGPSNGYVSVDDIRAAVAAANRDERG